MAENTGIFLKCPECGVTFEFPEPEQESALDEFGLWECPRAECPECAKNGIQTIHIINVNIPESEFDEKEIEEEPYFPPEEAEKRKKVRELMWKKRPDLKKKDRKKVDSEAKKKFEKKMGMPVDKVRRIYKEHITNLQNQNGPLE